MKVAITFLAFGKNIFAGMENALYSFSKGLIYNGHEVVIFSSFAHGDEQNIDGIRVYRSKFLPIMYSEGDRKIIEDITTNKNDLKEEFKKFLSEENPDILIAWDPLWGFVQYLDVSSFSKIPTFLSMHVISDDDVLKLSEVYPYKNRFGVSEAFINELHQECGYKSNIEILPNSIDFTSIYGDVNIEHGDSKENYIFCNARLSPEKGVVYALEGFAMFSERHPQFKLYLCDGDFPFGDKNIVKSEILSRAKELQVLDKLVFLPKLDWNNVPSVISKAYCTILPSLTESFGLAILESLALGKPTITTKVGNLPTLVQDAGILVEPKNSVQIADALEKIYQDESVYNELAVKAKNRALMFDNKKIADEFIKQISL